MDEFLQYLEIGKENVYFQIFIYLQPHILDAFF